MNQERKSAADPVRVLVVDDELDICNVIEELLLYEGYVVDKANSPEEALENFEAGVYDVLLCDVYLKSSSGMELLKQLRKRDPAMMAILMTGYASVEILVEAIKNGAYDFVHKPFQSIDIVNSVRRAVENKRLIEENLNLIEALRKEKSLLEQRVNAATADLRKNMQALTQLNTQLSAIMGLTLEMPEDVNIFHTLAVVSQRLKKALKIRECFFMLWDCANGSVNLEYYEDSRGAEYVERLKQALKGIDVEYVKSLAGLENYQARTQKIKRDWLRGIIPEEQSIETRFFPILVTPHLVGVFGICMMELTGLHEPEEQLISLAVSQIISSYEEMNYLARTSQLVTLGQLVGEIAHDLRHPMTSMKGSAQILKERWFEDELRQRTFSVLFEDLAQMEYMVAELYDFFNSRAFNVVPVEIQAIVDKSLQITRHVLSQKEISVECVFTEEQFKILGVMRPLIEALVNLIMNAAQAMQPGGRLIISVEQARGAAPYSAVIEPEDSRRFVAIRLTDNGCGIASADLNKIFKRFYTTKEKGTGLGLSAVKRIIKQNLGYIHVESELGKGTTFSVLLPLL